MKKILSIVLALLISLTMLNCVSAATSTDYEIKEVEIDGLSATSDVAYIERGSTLDVDAVLKANNSVEDIKVKAWIDSDYEYDEIEDLVGPFDLESGYARAVHLKLAIPEDMDASETYTLYVRASNGDGYEYEVSYPVGIEEVRHNLKVQDVIFRPSSTVAPGEYLRTVVRVENMGAKKEEDIKVTVKIPELGISQRDYVDELVAFEDDEDDEEDSQSSNEIMLQIPENAKAGDYEVIVDVEYSRGHEIASKKAIIHVSGETQENVEAIISIDSTSKQIAQGSEVAYKLMFANLGENVEVYSASVAGAELWANTRVDPAFVTVQAGQTGELFVYLQSKDNAELGNKMFTVKINSGANTVKEVTLNAEVTETGSNWGSVKNVLEIAFAVLVVLLIIMGLAIAFKRNNKSSDLEESDSEQTYY